jgi:hypothetical protein
MSNNELSDEEKKRLVQMAMHTLEPVAQKYELDTQTGRMALYEAFQLGIKFAAGEARKIEKEMNDGD